MAQSGGGSGSSREESPDSRTKGALWKQRARLSEDSESNSDEPGGAGWNDQATGSVGNNWVILPAETDDFYLIGFVPYYGNNVQA